MDDVLVVNDLFRSSSNGTNPEGTGDSGRTGVLSSLNGQASPSAASSTRLPCFSSLLLPGQALSINGSEPMQNDRRTFSAISLKLYSITNIIIKNDKHYKTL